MLKLKAGRVVGVLLALTLFLNTYQAHAHTSINPLLIPIIIPIVVVVTAAQKAAEKIRNGLEKVGDKIDHTLEAIADFFEGNEPAPRIDNPQAIDSDEGIAE